jgi:(p)ppGpp synthase/HD superfamily hydrolase
VLGKMLAVASVGHMTQKDKGGKPYFLHCMRVMQGLKTTDEELMCIALGHDLIEDTVISAEVLKYDGFSNRIINGILALTKVEGESYEQYKAKVMQNPDAILVKMQDLKDNSDITRLKGVTEKDIKRTIRYYNFYLELEAKAKEIKLI